MKVHAGVVSLAMVGLTWASLTTLAQGPGTPARPPAPAARAAEEPAVATVGRLRISRSELDARFQELQREYRGRTNADMPKEFEPILRRQLLEQLIRQRLAMLEAQRRGMTVSYEEAEAELKRDPAFQQNGMFNEARFLAIKSSQPVQFNAAIENIRVMLPARRLSEAIERENRPPDAELRAAAERKLTRATLDFLPLRRNDFDGAAPEPRESDLLEYHRTHASEFRLPEEAHLSVVFVNQPALPESLRSVDTAHREWEKQMARRADSALVAIRKGATLESIADPFGGVKSNIVVRRDNFPGYWRGAPQVNGALFSMQPGRVLTQAVPAEPGLLLVRLDELVPARTAPLKDVANEIRAKLRLEARTQREDRELRALYATVRDSLRGSAFRIRYAAVDTGLLRVAEPSSAELDRYYRGHLADYSSFDAKSGSVVAKPLGEVRNDVRSRILIERREEVGRATAQRVLDVWTRGKRDAALERGLTMLREVGPIPVGGAVDTGLVGIALTDSLAGREWRRGPQLIRYARGLAVFDLFEEVQNYAPTLEQARPILAQRLASARTAGDESGARALYDEDPGQFRRGNTLHFTRLVVPNISVLDVQLSRKEVEDFYHQHIDDYSAPQLARARHILISPKGPSPEQDAEARQKAEDLLRRVRAGEELAALARQYSDDPATRDDGGDVGVFRRGMMLEAFERVVFRMKLGEISDVIKTQVGYHVVECTEATPQEVTPLKYAYANVAGDAAQAKSDSLTKKLAENLLRTFKTPAQAKATARKLGLAQLVSEHVIGDRFVAPELRRYFEVLETIPPGQIYPGAQQYRGLGWVLTCVDSIAPSHIPSWEEVREKALERYRQGAGQRAMLAKKAELDSLGRQGWSLDSLGTLWGGLEHLEDLEPGKPLPRLGGTRLVDSLVFGRSKPPVLQVGQETDWLEFPSGFARVRLTQRISPDAISLSSRVESERRLAMERKLQAAYEKLRQRYPVKILDAELRATALPPIPDS